MVTEDRLQGLLDELESGVAHLRGRDLLTTWEWSVEELGAVLASAAILRSAHGDGLDCRVFHSGLGVSIFRDNSTRTRYSYAAALNLLGLGEYAIDEETSQIAHGETTRETATMLSFLTEVIGIRDDVFLGRGDAYMREVSHAVAEASTAGILSGRPSVINLQSDVDHPTQSLADLCALVDTFGGVEQLRGRTLAMTWAYSPSYGKPMSVPQGVIGLAARMGMNIRLAHPPGYGLLEEIVQQATANAAECGGSLVVGHDMDEAFDGAEVVYPKSWASLEVMKRRTTFLEAADSQGLDELERECLRMNAKHLGWECTEARMATTAGARYMHCLPADITGVSCRQGEVAAEVFQAHLEDTYRQASNKPYVIAAVIALTRLADPLGALRRLSAGRSE